MIIEQQVDSELVSKYTVLAGKFFTLITSANISQIYVYCSIGAYCLLKYMENYNGAYFAAHSLRYDIVVIQLVFNCIASI